MPPFKKILLAVIFLAPVALGGCTTMTKPTTGFAPPVAGDVAASASASDAIPLPDAVAVAPTSRVTVKPAAYRTDGGKSSNVLALMGIAEASPSEPATGKAGRLKRSPNAGPELDALIAKYAALHDLPVEFVHRVVNRESTYNPKAYSKGNWGLMQIRHATARGMGYDGPAKGLLDPETNLKYAVKYLKGAYLVANGDERLADRMYQRGYYYDAKRKGLLDETGLGRDRVRGGGA